MDRAADRDGPSAGRRRVDLKGARLLVVDDVPANLDVLCPVLEAAGYQLSVATDGARALEMVGRWSPEAILLDVVMPDMDGFEVCRWLQADAATREIPVIFLTASDEAEQVLQGFTAGGVDYILKPYRDEEVLARIRTHLERARFARALAERNEALARLNAKLQEEMARRRSLTDERDRLVDRLTLVTEREEERWGIDGLIGESKTLRKILADVRLLQQADTTSVLIRGESGTGKELIARALHAGSGRREGPFVPVNCASIPRDLAESLLFGHRKGAFSGAESDQRGYFRMADGGTLFLDEVGDMPLQLQTKLLRVLEDGAVRPLGEEAETTVDVRVLSATNADLQAAVDAGTFRQDLYFRLARFVVEVPPLRQRPGDVRLLAQHFLNILAEEMGRTPPALTAPAMTALEDYDFPGNVRELRNIVERALLESRGGDIAVEHLHWWSGVAPDAGPSSPAAAAAALPLDLVQAQVEVAKRALKMADGNMSQAAKLLGVHRNTLYRVLAREA